MNKNEFYRATKIAGMLLFIPLILVSGPLSGYFIGDYLVKKVHLPAFVLFICIVIGFVAAFAEMIRIIKMALRVESKSGHGRL